jgi:anti-sigma regulatory factor (Ser/Thr protein kinase)
MINERHFYLEKKEAKTKSYEVDFNDRHFGEIERPGGTDKLVGDLHNWWAKICSEAGLNPEAKHLAKAHYYIMELGKNALEHGDGGKIKVIFELHKITVITTDQGHGFEDLEDVEYCSSSQYGHGLNEVRKYSDDFCVESGGRKYAKVKGKRKLIDSGESDIKTGSKITFIKNFENTSPNTE